MSSYCFSIFGVLLLAMNGARVDWNGSGIRSPSWNNLDKKSPVSDTVRGPPMFMKTTPVGLFGASHPEDRQSKLKHVTKISVVERPTRFSELHWRNRKPFFGLNKLHEVLR
jgi:hypothetical protein